MQKVPPAVRHCATSDSFPECDKSMPDRHFVRASHGMAVIAGAGFHRRFAAKKSRHFSVVSAPDHGRCESTQRSVTTWSVPGQSVPRQRAGREFDRGAAAGRDRDNPDDRAAESHRRRAQANDERTQPSLRGDDSRMLKSGDVIPNSRRWRTEPRCELQTRARPFGDAQRNGGSEGMGHGPDHFAHGAAIRPARPSRRCGPPASGAMIVRSTQDEVASAVAGTALHDCAHRPTPVAQQLSSALGPRSSVRSAACPPALDGARRSGPWGPAGAGAPTRHPAWPGKSARRSRCGRW